MKGTPVKILILTKLIAIVYVDAVNVDCGQNKET
jgi:hypothetical protein